MSCKTNRTSVTKTQLVDVLEAKPTFHHIAFLTLLAPLLKPCADTASVSDNTKEYQASETQQSQHLILYARVSATGVLEQEVPRYHPTYPSDLVTYPISRPAQSLYVYYPA